MRALDVADKTQRVHRFQQATVAHAQQIIASMGLAELADVAPWMLVRRVDEVTTRSYAKQYEWLADGELLAEPPESWAADWRRADPDSFRPRSR